MIGLVQNAPQILSHTARRQLNNEIPTTFMTEAEAVVNSRPLPATSQAAPGWHRAFDTTPVTSSQI